MRSVWSLSPRPPRRCSKQSKITMVSIYTLVASFLIHLQQLRRRIGGDLKLATLTRFSLLVDLMG